MASEGDRALIAHLLRRFGLGATEEELDRLSALGFARAVDSLLSESDEGTAAIGPERFVGENGRLNPAGAVAWWTLHLVTTRRVLREKLTVFWHNHFATSLAKVGAPLMAGQIETLRSLALGRFPDLLGAIARDPAMLVWLDGAQNVRGRPNENFARELLELFTIGIGSYSEQDVREAARAFTGWSLRRIPSGPLGPSARFQFRPAFHDDGEKTVLGQTGRLGGDDVLSLLCDRPETSRRIVRRFFEWFVFPNPDDATVERFARRYRESEMDARALVREIALSGEFRSSKARRAIVKSPLDFVVPTLRQCRLGERLLPEVPAEGPLPRRLIAPLQAAAQAMRAMGMALMAPPDVAGWEGGESWISSAAMAERLRWATTLLGGLGRALPAAFFSSDLGLDQREPEALARRLASLFDAPPMPELEGWMAEAAAKRRAEGARSMAEAAAKVLFGSPAFQRC
ncbi:MAG: DUF1800 domain-containing protein [Fimbriimonadales bacterium]|nr:DUF1800 domain-containing protein [Fimbriimonadales bacterium]